MNKIKITLQNLFDSQRQNDINRLVTRGARRCVRDFKHALDSIPDTSPEKKIFRKRVEFWEETFWDTHEYRDDLYRTLDMLQCENKSLEAEIQKLKRELEQLRNQLCHPKS